jgi:hypothetical protein
VTKWVISGIDDGDRENGENDEGLLLLIGGDHSYQKATQSDEK